MQPSLFSEDPSTRRFTEAIKRTNSPSFGKTLEKPNWNLSSLLPFEKNFYRPHSTIRAMSEEGLLHHDIESQL